MPICNIPNFWPNTYRQVPIDYDDYVDVYGYIGSKTPLHMNMMICFIYIGSKPIIDEICICLFVLGMDPEAHDWWDVCVERAALENMSIYNCVERKVLEDMKI